MCWHASESGPVSTAIQASMHMIRKAIGAWSDVAICCDGANNFRKQIDPTYKAQREQQSNAMYGQLAELKERLRGEGLLLWEFETFEADDVIATATRFALAAGHEVVINTPDKDLLQLVSDKVIQVSPRTWIEMGPAQVMEKFGVPPSKVGDFLAICGDKADNIPGIEGAGPKCAANLLDVYGTLTGVMTALETDLVAIQNDKRFSRWAKVLGAFATTEGAFDRLALSRSLIALRDDVPLRFDEIFEERKAVPMTTDDEGDVPISDPGLQASTADKSENLAANIQPMTLANAIASQQGASLAKVQDAGGSTMQALQQFDAQLQPTGMAGLWWLAKRVVESGGRAGKFKSVDEALMVMLRGRDFGLTAAAAADIFHVIEGKPCPPAQLLISRAMVHPDCEYFQCVEADAQHAKWICKSRRNKEPSTVTYTIEQAEAAGLTKKPVWQKYAEDLLVARSGVRLARRDFPDATLGAYAFEEMEEHRG